MDIGGGVGMELVCVRPGRDPVRSEVEITGGLYIGKYPVTQGQYEAVTGETPGRFGGAERPVERVSWSEAVDFCARLGERTGCSFRLPTVAEWEYACRAAAAGRYCFGDNESKLHLYAWHDRNSGGETHVVGGKMPNDWGLFDVHGNVWEWCRDRSGEEADGSGEAPPAADCHAVRGGSWSDKPASCLTGAGRGRDGRFDDTGFRVVMTF